jgi:hypothetical protein
MLLRVTLALSIVAMAAMAQNANEKPFGLLRPTPERYQNYPITGSPPRGVLPPQSSLESYLPPPGSQGATQGSCTAWSVAYALRTALQAQINASWRPLNIASREFSPAFIFNTVKAKAGGVINCTAGIYFDTALDLLQQTGALTLDRFPYDPGDCSRSASQGQIAQAKPFRISSWFRLPDLQMSTIKTQIADGNPVPVGIDVYESFENAIGPSTIKGKTGAIRGYHAIVLIGYDDDKNAFRFQNSWGQTWGDNGRAWIDYDTLGVIIHEAYRVTPQLPPSALQVTQRFGIVDDALASAEDTVARLRDFVSRSELLLNTPEAPGKYDVFVNGFASKDQALNLARSITQGPSGLDAKIQPRTVNGIQQYLVLVGAQLSQLEATVVKDKALRAGFTHTDTLRRK